MSKRHDAIIKRSDFDVLEYFSSLNPVSQKEQVKFDADTQAKLQVLRELITEVMGRHIDWRQKARKTKKRHSFSAETDVNQFIQKKLQDNNIDADFLTEYVPEILEGILIAVPDSYAVNNDFFDKEWATGEFVEDGTAAEGKRTSTLELDRIAAAIDNFEELTSITKDCVYLSYLPQSDNPSGQQEVIENLREELGSGQEEGAHVELMRRALAAYAKLLGIEKNDENRAILNSTKRAKEEEIELYNGEKFFAEPLAKEFILQPKECPGYKRAAIAGVAAAHESKASFMLAKFLRFLVVQCKAHNKDVSALDSDDFREYFDVHLGKEIVTNILKDQWQGVLPDFRTKTAEQFRREGLTEFAHARGASDDLLQVVMGGEKAADKIEPVEVVKGLALGIFAVGQFTRSHGGFWRRLGYYIENGKERVRHSSSKERVDDDTQSVGSSSSSSQSLSANSSDTDSSVTDAITQAVSAVTAAGVGSNVVIQIFVGGQSTNNFGSAAGAHNVVVGIPAAQVQQPQRVTEGFSTNGARALTSSPSGEEVAINY